jgi:hypothetical protein
VRRAPDHRGVSGDACQRYDFAWGALIAIGLAAFTLQWRPAAREQFMRGTGGAVA